MSNTGKIKNATPLEVDGIQFKSKLEVYCYNKLKENNLQFDYETERFIILPKFTFTPDSFELTKSKEGMVYTKASPLIRAITYTPDFTNLKDGWIIECKGHPNDSYPLRWKLFKKHIIDNDLNYNLYVPRNRKQVDETIKLIKSNNESV